VRELGEIDMVSRALATLDLVTHDDALWAFPAVRLEDRTLSSGELAGLAGESERVLCHESNALVLWAEDRDLPALLAYLAALRLGHAVAFLLWRDRGDRRDAGPRRRVAWGTLGSVVGAHVVLRPGASVRKAELAVHCGRRLAGHKIAKHLMFVDQVLRSAAGKVQRWWLANYHENGTTLP
jgi:acyl-CoA synthetase (AMP-forming)/AMP-acid ligase II